MAHGLQLSPSHPTPAVRRSRGVLMVGGAFHNQGAFLMMTAVAHALRTRFDARPVVDVAVGTRRQKRRSGFDALWPPALGRVGPGRSRRADDDRWSYVTAADVDAVIDISGFRYSDQWANLRLDRYARYLSSWADRGVPVLMLPQAFGPFERTAAAGRLALSSASVVMPRDPESEEHVCRLLGPDAAAKVLRFPDFTAGLDAAFPTGYEHLRGGVAVIPNWNIWKRRGAGTRDAYLDLLTGIVRHLQDEGELVYGLSHEGRGDTQLLRQLASRADGLEVVAGLDGVEAKGLLRTCSLVVAGRFHALVSSLSQGVPSVIHGWSHKYRWLADDYGSGDAIADPLASLDENLAVVDRVRRSPDLRETLQAASQAHRSEVARMWDTLEPFLADAS